MNHYNILIPVIFFAAGLTAVMVTQALMTMHNIKFMRDNSLPQNNRRNEAEQAGFDYWLRLVAFDIARRGIIDRNSFITDKRGELWKCYQLRLNAREAVEYINKDDGEIYQYGK